jgi:hypothetical protein
MSHSQAPENSLHDLFAHDFVVCVVWPSTTPVPTTTPLLLCLICSRAFNPSKKRNCKLRRHLKNVHIMSPTMHLCRCKWYSLPYIHVTDDKDRRERTHKSKCLCARKCLLRRRVEDAALVLRMLYQAALMLSMLYQAV